MHPSTDRLRALAKDLTRYMNRKYGSGDDLRRRVVDNAETKREAPESTWSVATQRVQDLKQRFQIAVSTAADQFDNDRFPFLRNCSALSAKVRLASVLHSFTAKNWRGRKRRCRLYKNHDDHASPPEYYIEYRNERNVCKGITKITDASYESFGNVEGLPKRFTFQSTTSPTQPTYSQTQPTYGEELALTFSDVRVEEIGRWQWYVTVQPVTLGGPDSTKWWKTEDVYVIRIWQKHVENFDSDKDGNVSKEKIIQSIYTLPYVDREMPRQIILLYQDGKKGIQLTIPPTEDSLIRDWGIARMYSQKQ